MRSEFSHSTACVVLWKWIYFFHMPLFIFISGFFSRKKEKNELWPSIWKLLEPLLVFHVLMILPKIIFKGPDWNSILTPWYVLWYLLSLIYWRLILQIIPDRILNNVKLVLIVTFCISILAGFLPFNRLLSIQRTLSLMPFFFLGYYMKGKNIYLPDKFKPLSFAFLLLMVIIPLFFPQYLGDVCQADPYDSFYGAFKRIFVFVLCIPMSLAFINVCPNTSWFSGQGRLTMQYYIYHAFAVLTLFIIADKLNIPMSFVSASIFTFSITIGIGIASYLPFFKNLTNPSNFILKK